MIDLDLESAPIVALEAAHRTVNTGNDVLRAVYMWSAAGGKREVIRVPSELLEPVPEQPPHARVS